MKKLYLILFIALLSCNESDIDVDINYEKLLIKKIWITEIGSQYYLLENSMYHWSCGYPYGTGIDTFTYAKGTPLTHPYEPDGIYFKEGWSTARNFNIFDDILSIQWIMIHDNLEIYYLETQSDTIMYGSKYQRIKLINKAYIDHSLGGYEHIWRTKK